jgi:solute carrier family 24 (sodium/potassium/calcium exchanger), member 6
LPYRNFASPLHLLYVQCKPLKFPPRDQCAHVQDVCPTSDTFLHIPYIQRYFCTPEPWRPALFVGFVIWLSFLFSTLGISASDFFCPNLATVAQVLGLDQNVAGVTFLAFGNGSPDVFATFSSMRTNSAGLAIGEMLGAASFIISVVVGSMCIIKPFKADPFPFLRDVGFFTLAVALLIATLWDGKIQLWEAGGLVVVYAVYVSVVVLGTWWMKRRELRKAREALVRNEYAPDEVPQIAYHDEAEGYQDERELLSYFAVNTCVNV